MLGLAGLSVKEASKHGMAEMVRLCRTGIAPVNAKWSGLI